MITIFHMSKNQRKIDHVKQRYGRYKKDLTKLPKMKTTTSKIKSTLDRNNGRLGIPEEKFNELEITAIDTIK